MISIVVMASSRTVGSVVGMIAGQFLIPVPFLGALFGAVVGLCASHWCAKKFTESEAVDWLAGRIDNFIKTKYEARRGQLSLTD